VCSGTQIWRLTGGSWPSRRSREEGIGLGGDGVLVETNASRANQSQTLGVVANVVCAETDTYLVLFSHFHALHSNLANSLAPEQPSAYNNRSSSMPSLRPQHQRKCSTHRGRTRLESISVQLRNSPRRKSARSTQDSVTISRGNHHPQGRRKQPCRTVMVVCLIPESGTPAGYSFIGDRRGCRFVTRFLLLCG
jgi:hypothetical protein